MCSLELAALNGTLEKGAAEIAQYYATTAQQLSLNQGGAKGVHDVCNWECSSDPVITPMAKAFGFLQYHCANAKGPRQPTGPGTKSQLGLSITDADYRDAADAIFRSGSSGVGDLMRMPSSIEEASKSGKVKDVIDAVEAIPGALWIKYSSTSVDNDNEGAARILIRVSDSEETPRAASKDPAGGVLPGLFAYREWLRAGGGSSRSELSKCYSCHPSGLRPVIPAKEGTIAVGGGKAIPLEGTMLVGADLAGLLENLEKMTSHLAVFGPTGYTASENGPPFGPSERSGRAEFVAAGCGKGLAEDRRAAVVEQMDCQMCHSGSHRGVLRASTSRVTIYHKVVENTVAPMPPGVTDSLSPAERKVLFKCLKAEYAELLREWLISDRLAVPDFDAATPLEPQPESESESEVSE